VSAIVLLLDTWAATRDPNPIISASAYAGSPVREYCQRAGVDLPSPLEGRLESGFALWKPTTSRAEYVAQRRRLGLMNTTLSEGLSKVDGFLSVGPRWQETWCLALLRLQASAGPNQRAQPLLDFCGVRLIGASDDQNWVARSNAMQLVSIGQRTVLVTNDGAALKVIGSASFDPRRLVVLEQPVDAEPDPEAKAVLDRFEDERWIIHAEASRPTLLVISQTWYPGWSARVNGEPSEILRANVAFQAVEVPAGTSSVELRYREPGLAAGAALSGVSLAFCIVLVWRGGRTWSWWPEGEGGKGKGAGSERAPTAFAQSGV